MGIVPVACLADRTPRVVPVAVMSSLRRTIWGTTPKALECPPRPIGPRRRCSGSPSSLVRSIHAGTPRGVVRRQGEG
jgi:hypothetical protein